MHSYNMIVSNGATHQGSPFYRKESMETLDTSTASAIALAMFAFENSITYRKLPRSPKKHYGQKDVQDARNGVVQRLLRNFVFRAWRGASANLRFA